MTKLTNAFVNISILLLILLNVGCSTINPKLQDEYIRKDLNHGMLAVMNENRQTVQQFMTKGKIPGLSLAIVDRKGILWAAGFGYSDKNNKIPMTTETLSSVCSFTKVFTGTAVMFAIQDGQVELDVPIIQYIPEFSVNSRFEKNPQEIITLRHLLTHSSGLTRETGIGNFYEAEASFAEHIKSISNTWLEHKVGERLGYSNIGMDLVAHILEIRTERPFAEYLKDKIFKPLYMADTSADMNVIINHPKRALSTMPHVKLSLKLIDTHRGSGSVFTNAKDLSRFIQFHLNHGKVDDDRVLDEKLIDLMYTASALDPNPYPEHRLDYALGVWVFTTLKDGNHKVGHDGAGAGFTSLGWWYPEFGFGGLILARSNDLYQENEKAWLDNIMRSIINKKLVEKNADFNTVPWKTKWGNDPKGDSWCDPNTFTPYQQAWKKYKGTYRYRFYGHKLPFYLNMLIPLVGIPQAEMKVREKDGYLVIIESGAKYPKRLDEYQPGLFFTQYGSCLDLRNKIPTWESVRLKKVK